LLINFAYDRRHITHEFDGFDPNLAERSINYKMIIAVWVFRSELYRLLGSVRLEVAKCIAQAIYSFSECDVRDTKAATATHR